MKAALFAACENGIIDAQSKMLSVINIMNEVSAAGFPIVLPKVSAAGILDREAAEPTTFDCRLVISLNGEELANLPWGIDFQGKSRLQACATFQGLLIATAGKLRFALMHQATTIGAWELNIISLGPQADMFTNAGPEAATDQEA